MKYGNWLWVAIVLSALLAGCDLFGPVVPCPDDTAENWRNAPAGPGDTWTYAITQRNEEGKITFLGTLIRTIGDQTVTDLAGQVANVHLMTGEWAAVDFEPTTYSSQAYYSQDAAGDWYLHGEHFDDDGGYDAFVTAEAGGKISILPHPATIGATSQWDVVYDNGYQWQGRSEVVAHETIITAMGTCCTARIEVEQVLSRDGKTRTLDCTYWLAPQLSKPLLFTIDYTETDNATQETSRWSKEYEMTESSLP